MWGIPGIFPFSLSGERFIPTRVGNTLLRKERRRIVAVHPHACGEYVRQTKHSQGSAGSSPRVWGIRSSNQTQSGIGRFIPTRVGNTTWCRKVGIGDLGSSPRVWGIRHLRFDAGSKCRFIPTRVGNTKISRLVTTLESVHPHACGEYITITVREL